MKLAYTSLLILTFITCSCLSNRDKYTSPKHYSLTEPEKFVMPTILREISGIAFSQGNPDTMYAEQDEQGKIFKFKLGEEKLVATKFAKKGDYEDIAICNGTIIMLRSDGTLFTFPLSETNKEAASYVQEWNNLLPNGEYEGMYANASTNEIFILCKHCDTDKTNKQTTGHLINLSGEKLIYNKGFIIDIAQVQKLTGNNKLNFHPSALAWNSHDKQWFILSSVNHMLVLANADWKVEEVHTLNPAIFNQPEGMAFDKDGNLYISNEGGEGNGNVLKFKRIK